MCILYIEGLPASEEPECYTDNNNNEDEGNFQSVKRKDNIDMEEYKY